MAQIKHSFGLLANYNAIQQKDPYTIYWVTDVPAIYFNNVKYTFKEAQALIGNLSSLTTTAKTTLVAAINELDGKIGTLNADDTTAGSVAKAVKDAIDALTASGIEITTITGLNINEAAATNVQEALEALKALIDNAENNSAVTVVQDQNSGNYAAVYHIQQNGVNVGVPINVPKDLVVQSGSVVTNYDATHTGTWIRLVIQNQTQPLWIDVASLIEYVTSGSTAGDMVVVAVDPTTHQVTATITDGTITKAKLTATLQASIDKADSAVQGVKINGTELTKDSTNKVNFEPKASDIEYTSTETVEAAIDRIDSTDVPAKADKVTPTAANNIAVLDSTGNLADGGQTIAGVKNQLIGTNSDTGSSDTIYGAKKYADSLLEWGTF